MAMDQFLCWKLKTATICTVYYCVVAGGVAALLEILDIAALASDSFDIIGGFKASWRAHVWEGWLATNIVLLVCHLIVIAYSIVVYFAVERFPTFYEYHITKGYTAILILYTLCELGCCLYRYSWYGPNTFRLPYLVFTWILWVVRTLMNITCIFIVSARCAEIKYEITFGEKKPSGNVYSSSARLLESAARSGFTTPGTATPRGAIAVNY